jgi:hypothetical protein
MRKETGIDRQAGSLSETVDKVLFLPKDGITGTDSRKK